MRGNENKERENTIIKVSIQGIFVNLILVGFKAFVGLMANSIAIILDAVNNLSDACSQVVTIAGTKLSAKAPDKKHPYGYGRIEYISSSIVALIILLAGFTSFKESVLKTIHPEVSEYSTVSLIIIGVAVIVKFSLGQYVKAKGVKIASQALIAAGTDSFMDSILSLSTFVAALLSKFAGLNVEGILGIGLSVLILKAGFEIISETLGKLIGDRTDSEFSLELKKKIRSFEGVNGAYDLILHDYGPSRSIGSVHIEIDGNLTAEKIHLLSRRIIFEIYEEYGIVLTVGIYASTEDEQNKKMRAEIAAIATAHKNVLQIHGFFVDEQRKSILFDMVVSYKEKDMLHLISEVQSEVSQKFPGYSVDINVDHDFSD